MSFIRACQIQYTISLRQVISVFVRSGNQGCRWTRLVLINRFRSVGLVLITWPRHFWRLMLSQIMFISEPENMIACIKWILNSIFWFLDHVYKFKPRAIVQPIADSRSNAKSIGKPFVDIVINTQKPLGIRNAIPQLVFKIGFSIERDQKFCS